MTNFSDNVQKALGYLRSNGINMIYIFQIIRTYLKIIQMVLFLYPQKTIR